MINEGKTAPNKFALVSVTPALVSKVFALPTVYDS